MPTTQHTSTNTSNVNDSNSAVNSNGTTAATTNGSTTAWAPQAADLSTLLTGANSALTKAQGATAPTDFTAGMTPEQLATFRSMIGYGGNNAIPGQQASLGLNSANSGLAGATGALSGLSGFNPSATNNMGSVISGANAYANGFDVPGAVQAAMRDATQEARDVTKPQIDNSAASSGNINSSRTAIEQGLVDRGLAEKAGDLSATLRNNLFSQGAGTAEGILSGNNAANLSALTGAGALGSNMFGSGNGVLGNSIANQGNLFNIANAGGSGLQTGNQLGLTNQLQQYQSGVNSPFDAWNNYQNLVGSRMYGTNTSGSTNGTTSNDVNSTAHSAGTGTSEGTTTTTPSAMQIIGSGLGMLGSAIDPTGGLMTGLSALGKMF